MGKRKFSPEQVRQMEKQGIFVNLDGSPRKKKLNGEYRKLTECYNSGQPRKKVPSHREEGLRIGFLVSPEHMAFLKSRNVPMSEYIRGLITKAMNNSKAI